jgi:hypothetical protein
MSDDLRFRMLGRGVAKSSGHVPSRVLFELAAGLRDRHHAQATLRKTATSSAAVKNAKRGPGPWKR